MAFLAVVGAQIGLCDPDDNPIFEVQRSDIACFNTFFHFPSKNLQCACSPGVEGQRKLTKVAATGVLRGLVPRAPIENASSQSILEVGS